MEILVLRVKGRTVKSASRFLLSASLMSAVCCGTAHGCSVISIEKPAEVSRDVLVYFSHRGSPVGNIAFTIIDKSNGQTIRQMTADGQGRAEIHHLPKGNYTIASSVAGQELVATGKEGTTTLRLGAVVPRAPVPLARINGTVIDPSGAGLENAAVVIERVDKAQSPVAAMTLDKTGVIALKGTPGIYVMRIGAPGFQTAAIPIQVSNTGWSGFRLTLRLLPCPPDSGNPYLDYVLEPER